MLYDTQCLEGYSSILQLKIFKQISNCFAYQKVQMEMGMLEQLY